MKKTLLIAVAAALTLNSCKKESDLATPAEAVAKSSKLTTQAVAEYPVKPTDTLSGDYTTPLHLDKSKTWFLDGVVLIKNTTITIDPGTIIVGLYRQTAQTEPCMLVIDKDATINAKGTANEPIIFTSKYLVDGLSNTPALGGDFGGLLILGQAPTAGPTTIPFWQNGTAVERSFSFGGNNTTHSSGELSFVRVEYGGGSTNSYSVVDAVQLMAVGKSTKIDHIESANAKNNAFNLHGGNVNIQFLVAPDYYLNGIDINSGYNGTLQYGVILTGNRRYNDDGVNGIYCSTSTISTQPVTHPIINNFTIVGEDKATTDFLHAGIMLGQRAEVTLTSSIILGYTEGITIMFSNDLQLFRKGVNKAQNNIITGAAAAVSWGNINALLDAAGNKRYAYPLKTNSFTRLRQPFLPLGDVNLVPLSVSPANQTTTNQAGAFNDYSRPASVWNSTSNWYKLYY